MDSDLLAQWKKLAGVDREERKAEFAKRNELAAGLQARLKVANLMKTPLSGISTAYALRFAEGIERFNARPKPQLPRHEDVPTAGTPWKLPWNEEEQARYAALPEHDPSEEPDWERPGKVQYPAPVELDHIHGLDVEEPVEQPAEPPEEDYNVPEPPKRKRDPQLLKQKGTNPPGVGTP